MKGRLEALVRQWKEKIPLGAVAVLAIGCLLLGLPAEQKREEAIEAVPGMVEQEALAHFEQRLEQVLSSIAGAGETRVVLSLDSGSRQILARDREQDSTGASEKTVTIGASSSQQVVPVQTRAPVFRGALVVCPGAADARVRLEITKAVCVLTGLGTDCVCVSTGIA